MVFGKKKTTEKLQARVLSTAFTCRCRF